MAKKKKPKNLEISGITNSNHVQEQRPEVKKVKKNVLESSTTLSDY